ncbi:MAG TPA: hypothetical protein VMK12_29890 [Anaeromyxobacteraceae bacterium]|nr:hypothetical protein [Anaeromyxobacteraceae bacterium]
MPPRLAPAGERLFFANQGAFRTGDYGYLSGTPCALRRSFCGLEGSTGKPLPMEDIARVSPLAHAHVIPSGTCHFPARAKPTGTLTVTRYTAGAATPSRERGDPEEMSRDGGRFLADMLDWTDRFALAPGPAWSSHSSPHGGADLEECSRTSFAARAR